MHKFPQFFLLFYKDWMLLKRNKFWTIFEVFIPCLVMFPIVLSTVANPGSWSKWHQEKIYSGFTLKGGIGDVSTIGSRYWCSKNQLKIGYSSSMFSRVEETRNVMKMFGEKFNTSNFRIETVEFDNESNLVHELKNDLKNGSFKEYCNIVTYIGGVVFDEIDSKTKILRYRIYIADGMSKNDWKFGEEWRFPYGGEPSPNNIPDQPPYYNSGFLLIQHAVETSFIEIVKGRRVENAEIALKGLPQAEYTENILSSFIQNFPTLFAFITFLNVCHVGRECASENETIKPYLTAMGLSTSMFYLNHVLVALAKFLPVLFLTVLPLVVVIKYVSLTTIFTAVFLYGMGAIMFGAMIGSFFKNDNSAVKTIAIIWTFMIIFAWFWTPGSDQIIKCIFYGLNINGAFKLAIDAISGNIKRERELDLLNMFDDSTHFFSFGLAVLLMIFDVVWMFGLTIYIDLKGSGFCFKDLLKMFVMTEQVEKKIDECEIPLEESHEIDGARSLAKSGIRIRNLVKVWPTTGERAVDGLSFEAKQGQVSVLLGHNGAGKSTTFQSVAGIVKPTEGEILICDKDVGSWTCQHVGLCPQYNPLYDKLTVEEHLWLMYGLRGRWNVMKFEEEIERFLKDLKMIDKRQELAINLSGGMKRKLCVCMALIGQSDVVLLDEPTAGMDAGARKDVQDLLEREKKERTILLTTHYMDEAERLGDWILIMSHGKLVSSGTSKFLKQKYGTGYLLTVVLDVQGEKKKMAEVLEEVCKFYVMGAQRGERHGQQMEIVLPENEKNEFPQLFKALEAIQERRYNNSVLSKLPNSMKEGLKKLHITSFGLSLNTLEQVFITIGDKVEKNLKKSVDFTRNIDKKSGFERFIESQEPHKNRGNLRILSQIAAIFRKKWIYLRRNYLNVLLQIVTPIVLLIVIASMTSFSGEKASGMRIMRLPPTKYIWRYNPRQQSAETNKMQKILARDLDFEMLRFFETNSLTGILKRLNGDMPPIAFGFSDNFTLFNMRCYHILPPLISLHNTARLMDDVDERVPDIRVGMIVYSSDQVLKIPIEIWAKILFVPFVILMFTLLTSSFVTYLVEERVSMFAHQQLLTGCSPIVFHGASFAFDFVVFLTILLGFLSIVIASGHGFNNLAIITLFCIIYFFSSVPFVYTTSLLIESSSKANIFLLGWQLIISSIAIIFTYWIIPGVAAYLEFPIEFSMFLKMFCYFILPSFSFGTSVISASLSDKSFVELLEWEELGETAVSMLIFGMTCAVLFVGLHFRAVRQFLSKLIVIPKKRYFTMPDFNVPLCEAVKKEQEIVEMSRPEDFALIVKGMTKKFGRITAVENLNLAITENECFGLLGVNGAGKTTVFNILTGKTFATSGNAMIGGRDVAKSNAIGYCPQFDALLLDLTGREVLEILGQMHGFSTYRQKAELVLECVGMLPNADKLIRYYSGGQKRKISVGVALLAPTQMIILDEPTAGIDPKARREVWELLIWCRENSNSALMLTSHSMDECEALCSRIAVLNKGKLIAIGTSQELKSLYGNSYIMTLTLNEIEDRDSIVNQVRTKLPGSELRTPESNKTVHLVWQLPKNPGDNWSEKFGMVQELANQLNVKDYILSQSSLEETFLRLSEPAK